MEEQLSTHLEQCLEAIAAGDSVESCLARYLDEVGELAPLLQIALALESLPQPGPSEVTARAARSRFLGEVARWRQATQTGRWARLRQRLSLPTWPAPVRALASAALSLAFVLLIGGGVIYAASGSLPGDPLYGFKLLGEDVQRALTFKHEARIHLEERFTERRQDEVRQLLAMGRQEKVTFGGLLRERGDGTWHVEDIPVTVNVDTRGQAEPTANTFIEVHGITQADGTVLALLVEIEGVEIIGPVEVIGPDRWQVAGQRVLVDAQTYIQAGLRVGDWADVHARRFPAGTLLALEIERIQVPPQVHPEGETPTPTPRLSTTPTAVPASPTLTRTPSPTPSPAVIVTPSPTAEPGGDDEEEVTPTLQPTSTPTVPPPLPSPTPDDDEDDEDEEPEVAPTLGPPPASPTPSVPSPTPTYEDDDDGDDDDEGEATPTPGDDDDNGGSDGNG